MGARPARNAACRLPEMAYRALEAYLPLRHNVLERRGLLGQHALL